MLISFSKLSKNLLTKKFLRLDLMILKNFNLHCLNSQIKCLSFNNLLLKTL